MTREPSSHHRRPRLRSISTAVALLAAGTFIGVSSQHFASADVTSGDRPVLIPIEPCRLSDTRPGDNQVGPRAVPLGAGDVHTVDAQEADTLCTGKIPTDASALSLNVTALGATELSFLTIWAGGDRPLAASLNPAPGQPPVPNAVTTELSVDQEFEVYNNAGAVHVVIDVNGYYAHHNHDDRYFTETEVLDLMASERASSAGRIIAHGTISDIGTPVWQTKGAAGITVSTSELSTGQYQITLTGAFDEADARPTVLITPLSPGDGVTCFAYGNVLTLAGENSTITATVSCEKATGTPSATPFHFAVIMNDN